MPSNSFELVSGVCLDGLLSPIVSIFVVLPFSVHFSITFHIMDIMS